MKIPAGKVEAPAVQLEKILRQEQALLLAGEARQAAELNADKLALLDLLDPQIADGTRTAPLPDNLSTVRRLAGENASMLSAMLNGLRSALTRLGRVEHDASVGTYGQSGEKVPFDTLSGGYRKKM